MAESNAAAITFHVQTALSVVFRKKRPKAHRIRCLQTQFDAIPIQNHIAGQKIDAYTRVRFCSADDVLDLPWHSSFNARWRVHKQNSNFQGVTRGKLHTYSKRNKRGYAYAALLVNTFWYQACVPTSCVIAKADAKATTVNTIRNLGIGTKNSKHTVITILPTDTNTTRALVRNYN